MPGNFAHSDALIAHLKLVVPGLSDPLLVQKYTGLVCVMAVASYETSIKEIFIAFSMKKHAVFGAFITEHFSQINARIKLDDIRKTYVKRFGDKYFKKFDKKMNDMEASVMLLQKKSVKAAYANIIVWRHQFAHEGQLPTNATFAEAVSQYELGKSVVLALELAMQR